MVYGIIKGCDDVQVSLENDKYYELFICTIFNITHVSQWSIDTDFSMFLM